MVPATLVRARVVDITQPAAPIPRQVVVDANVLYFVHYPNFSALTAAGCKGPANYQTGRYPAWVARASRAKAHFYAALVTFGEFVRACEYSELEALWRTDPATLSGASFSPQACKTARYRYASRLSKIRQDALSFLQSASKSVDLLPGQKRASDALAQAKVDWERSAGDFADTIMVTAAKDATVRDILSDDVDLLTFDGITVYTANQTAISDARTAGKLV